METNTEKDLKKIEIIRDILKNHKQSSVRCIACSKEELEKIFIDYNKNQSKEIAERNIFKGGCEKEFVHKFWGNRICGKFEDLKHSDHYIYCPDCEKKQKIQKIYGEING